MTGDKLEAFGGVLSLAGVFLSIIVTAAILVQIGAPIWVWVLYIVELILIFVGAIMSAIGKHL